MWHRRGRGKRERPSGRVRGAYRRRVACLLATRRVRAVSGAASVALATAMVLAAAGSAPALKERGHVFGSTFGGAGSGAGEFLQPSGVAVDEASGDVYVVDRANARIDRFASNGAFIAAWGWGVADGAKEFEICETACQAGIPGGGKGQFNVPGGIAVDNSASGGDPSQGDVYVVADSRAEHGRVQKFTSAGAPLGAVKQAGVEPKWEGALDGVAVDGSGRLWVYRGVEGEAFIERFSDAGPNVFEEPGFESSLRCPRPGFGVDAAGEQLYVDHERENREEACPAEEGEPARPVVAGQLAQSGELLEARVGALDPLQTSGVAVAPASGEAYLSNVTSLAAFDAEGALIQRLALPGTSPDGSAVAVNGASGAVYVADAAAEKIDVFEPEGSNRPVVGGLSAQNLTASSARLGAQVDPVGSDTHYYFQYGTVSCLSSPASCTDVPAPPGADAGAGFSDVPVSVEAAGLKPSTTYYYRVVAANAHGEAEGDETFASITTLPSAEGLLPDGRAWEMVSPTEKDGSGIEPLRKEGGLIQSSLDGAAITYVANGPIVPEPEGSRAPYPTQAIATRSASGWASTQIVTPRTIGEGFIPGEAPEYRAFSGDLAQGLVQPDNQAAKEPLEQPPLAPGATEKTMYLRDSATGTYLPLVTPASATAGAPFGGRLEFAGASPDLQQVVLASQVPLLTGTAAGLYEWQAGASLQPVSVLPDGKPALEPRLGSESHNVRGAVANHGSRVVWTGESEVLNGTTVETVRHLYMRDMSAGKTVQLDAAVSGVAEPGEEESEVGFQAANSQGTRVFFTDTARLTEDSNLAPIPGVPGNPADLYECEVVEEAGKLGCKLQDLTVDQHVNQAADVLNVAPAVSEDGSYVYFVANGALAAGASPGDCVHAGGETAAPGASCNLYVWHEGAVSFIATLSNEDSGDWGSTEGAGTEGQAIEPRPDLAGVTAGSSPSGRYFAFMSSQSLTGYDNHDASSAAEGARAEEVYLYDANSKLLSCASCNPSGKPPHGVLDTQDAGEGLGLLVDRPQDWVLSPGAKAPTAHWLAGSLPGWTPLGNESAAQALRPPRYLSDSGRLFFNSADALVNVEHAHTRQELIGGERVDVGVEAVYQYEPNGLGSCSNDHGCVALVSSGTSEQESAFVDASSNGDGAFFVTAQPLVAADHDTNFDLYDARVCTSESPCLTSEGASSTPCESTVACRPASIPPTSTGSSGTEGVAGSGNVPRQETRGATESGKPPAKPLTRAQKLAKSLKQCRARYAHARKRRRSCEAKARTAHGLSKTIKHRRSRK